MQMTSLQHKLKAQVAEAAFDDLKTQLSNSTILGIGTGSTVNCFIEVLAEYKHLFKGAVASSHASKKLLNERGIELFELNEVSYLDFYIDGADEVDPNFNLIKGGGAALTQEKIIAAASKQFICIIDASKQVSQLGKFPLPIEVIPMARSFVARELVKIGATPEYRTGCITDNGNVILDVYDLNFDHPEQLEQKLNNIPGVVCNGIFALRKADIILSANNDGISKITA